LENSFTAAKSTKFPAKPILGYPPHLKCVAAGLKCAARGSLKILDAKKVAKNRHLGTISQLCRAISSQLRHVSTIGKKLLSSNMSSRSSHNMVNFGPLAAEIVSLVWGTTNFNWLRVFAALLHGM